MKISDDIYWMSLQAEDIARDSRPGQFVHMRIDEGIDPLLRRPFSIHRADRESGLIEILYRVVGRGTEAMSRAGEGHVFDLLGPLGEGFVIDKPFSRALIVAGGMGSAPIFFLIDELIAIGKDVILLWGMKHRGEFFGLSQLNELDLEVAFSTEDGSLGHSGLVTDLLEERLQELDDACTWEGFVCGPVPMLQRVQEIVTKTSFDWQVSLEKHMACGIGVCMGCAVQSKVEGYRMACSDGPVFDLKGVEIDG
jgi:dihydroorotate dehydrogenase electron transfer subunit